MSGRGAGRRPERTGDSRVIEDDEVQTGEVVGDPALPSGTPFGLEPIDEINGSEEAAARPVGYSFVQ